MTRPKAVHVIQVPYDLGREGTGLGLGPQRLLDAGAISQIEARDRPVRTTSVHRQEKFHDEVGAAFAVARALAQLVHDTAANGEFPLVLAGDCSASLGVRAGLGGDAGIVWFDAHGDFNTPETTVTGYFAGMALAAVAGCCWQSLCRLLPGFRPVPEENIVLAGVRAIDPLEELALENSKICTVSAGEIKRPGSKALEAALLRLGDRVKTTYVHLDMDVLDPQVARANEYAEPGGLTVREIEAALGEVTSRLSVGAAVLTAYDPRCDSDGAGLQAGLRLLRVIAGPGS